MKKRGEKRKVDQGKGGEYGMIVTVPVEKKKGVGDKNHKKRERIESFCHGNLLASGHKGVFEGGNLSLLSWNKGGGRGGKLQKTGV